MSCTCTCMVHCVCLPLITTNFQVRIAGHVHAHRCPTGSAFYCRCELSYAGIISQVDYNNLLNLYQECMLESPAIQLVNLEYLAQQIS